MASKKPRKPRKNLINPYFFCKAKAPMGKDSADRLSFPLLAHWYEAKRGNGEGETIRLVTCHLCAIYDIAILYKQTELADLAEKTIHAWLSCSERCAKKGIHQRIVLDGALMRLGDALICKWVKLLPHIEIGAYVDTVAAAQHKWESAANHKAPTAHPREQIANRLDA